jgi:NAD(P)-dependent dehydrogenase (short-subunit alcohol dehydrogenase family)
MSSFTAVVRLQPPPFARRRSWSRTYDQQRQRDQLRVGAEARAWIDILVNSVWGDCEGMIENGVFTWWSKPFWEQPLWRWDAMFYAGVRAHYHASQLAAPMMIAQSATA